MARTVVTPRRSKRRASRSKSPRPTVTLRAGDWLDVMDTYGMWNVARVLSVPSPGEVEITYDGWPKEFDEVVQVESHRVAPYHTFTWAVKCWVKYLNWPMWPAVITIRTPGTEEGIVNLMEEKRFHVDFFDHPDFEHRDRCWQVKQKGRLRAFDENYDEKRVGTNGEQFERSLGCALQSDATTKMPVFSKGMLPKQYENATTMSVDDMRSTMGNECWYKKFLSNRERHFQTHVYEAIGGISVNSEEKEVSGDAATAEKTKQETAVTKNPSSKKKRPLSAKAKRGSVKIEESSPIKVEVPYELEEIHSSQKSGDEDEQEIEKLKKKRPRLKTRSAARENAPARKSQHHVKGQTKMAARRSVPPRGGYLNLNANAVSVADEFPDVCNDNGAEGCDDLRVAVKDTGRIDPVEPGITKIATLNAKKQPKEKVCDEILLPGVHTQPSLPLIEQCIANAQEVLRELEEAKQKALELEEAKQRALEVKAAKTKATTEQDPRDNGKTPSIITPREKSMIVSSSAHKVGLREGSSERSVIKHVTEKEDASLRRVDVVDKGRVEGGPMEIVVDPEKLNASLVSEDKVQSSDSDESKGVSPQFEEDNAIDPISDSEDESKTAEKAEAKNVIDSTASSAELELWQSGLPKECISGEDEEEEESQEPRRRAFMMRADKEDANGVVPTDASGKVKYSTKTAISVPRKFDEEAIAVMHTFTSPKNSMLRIAPPPHLPVLGSSITGLRPGVPLSSPSTTVFSSSQRFSIESWFKRKLYADFMSGGAE